MLCLELQVRFNHDIETIDELHPLGEDSPHLPSPAAQAMNFINGLDVEIESYLQLKAQHTVKTHYQSLKQTDVYPKTFPDALPVLRFHRFKCMNGCDCVCVTVYLFL